MRTAESTVQLSMPRVSDSHDEEKQRKQAFFVPEKEEKRT